MNTSLGPVPLSRVFCQLAGLLLLWALCVGGASAAPIDLDGQWYELPHQASGPTTPTAPAESTRLPRVDKLSLLGGHYRHEARFDLAEPGVYVVDFKNSSVIGRFRHRLYGESNELLLEFEGGIESATPNPFFLRHARDMKLPAGYYRLVTEVDSPFFLAQPVPYLDTLAHYRQAIKPGNALVLVCLGVFVGLGIYYAVLALVRRRTAHAMYALFILGNLLYNASALLVMNDLFSVRWFHLISVPILFSNIAYVVFVMALLDIRADNTPRLLWLGRAVIAVMVAFIAVAAARPSWSLELDRYGVGLFLLYGLIAGLVHTLRGNPLARWYLLANAGFFASGAASISLLHLNGVYSIYIEHLGLMAVAIEVLLLALVLSYQFGVLQDERTRALDKAENNLRLACTDPLTGLPNRYALEIALAGLPVAGGLTFIDLDGLKYYNDRFGHERGDRLLCDFAIAASKALGEGATLHRLGGDEFAVTAPDGATDRAERMIDEAIDVLRRSGHELSGASCGSVHVHECSTREQLKHLADTRMYENKRQRRVQDLEQPLLADPI